MSKSNPPWYQEAIIYEAHVRTFYDSNNDGIGDFKGLTQKLDYLQDLGITAIWLLPFYPSPLKDDGYDIADYANVNPSYGTLKDCLAFLDEAHKRDLKVITELVLNHTSDQHQWFQQSRLAMQQNLQNKWRDFYVWSNDPNRYKEARIIFPDFEPSNWSWDPIAKSYYWHRFYSHQPDLNFDNPEVKKHIEKILQFWFSKGIDGLRLDAVPYLYEREGTNCEDLPETHAFLRELRAHIDDHYQDKMLLAEANQWPEDAIKYYGEGEECHMVFHFPLMPRMFMSLQMEDRFPLVDILEQTPAIPNHCQWALFLRNHDELTLEMVTDEERDYMYRTYAQDPQTRINVGIRRRLATLLGNNRKKIELMNGLLFSLPGTPVIYYGDEIGMGDNFYLGDRNGVRTPMQWSADRNAGFSRAHPHQLYLPVVIDPEFHYEAINVANQENNSESLLWWMKRLIAVRKYYRSFALGSLTFLYPKNRKIIAFIRHYQHETILVVANFSRFTEYTELDLTTWQGAVPVELFGQTQFPTINQDPYFLTLAPHAFYWFLLQPTSEGEIAINDRDIPELKIMTDWQSLLTDDLQKRRLEKILPDFLKQQKWYNHKSTQLKHLELFKAIPLKNKEHSVYISFIRLTTASQEKLYYLLPITFIEEKDANALQNQHPCAILARAEICQHDQHGFLVDGLFTTFFPTLLLQAMHKKLKFPYEQDVILAKSNQFFHDHYTKEIINEVTPLKNEHSNTSIAFANKFILKFFRYVEFGVSPEFEVARFLTEQCHFCSSPAIGGVLEFIDSRQTNTTLAILNEFIANEGDAWSYTVDNIKLFFEKVLSHNFDINMEKLPFPKEGNIFEYLATPKAVRIILGDYINSARLMGQRTGELHLALSSGKENTDFSAEIITMQQQRSRFQSIHMLHVSIFHELTTKLSELPPAIRTRCENLLKQSHKIDQFIRRILDFEIKAFRIRCHGDLHLGQILYTGKDFMIIDFEGDATKPISTRKLKRSPLRDVASMLRSFHYAAQTAWLGKFCVIREQDQKTIKMSANFWHQWVATFYLQGYFDVVKKTKLIPQDITHCKILLDILQMEQALLELDHELKHRPDWILIPYRGIMELLNQWHNRSNL